MRFLIISHALHKTKEDAIFSYAPYVLEMNLWLKYVEKVEIDHVQVESFLPQIYSKLEWMDRNELIQRFVSVEFNRFLEYYKNAADLNKPDGKRNSGKSGRTSENMTRFFINLGKTDDLKPTSVIGLIKDYSGSKDLDIGEIDIKQNFSFFETESEYKDVLINNMNGQDFNGRKISLEIASARTDDRGDRGSRSRGPKKSFRSGRPKRDWNSSSSPKRKPRRRS